MRSKKLFGLTRKTLDNISLLSHILISMPIVNSGAPDDLQPVSTDAKRSLEVRKHHRQPPMASLALVH